MLASLSCQLSLPSSAWNWISNFPSCTTQLAAWLALRLSRRPSKCPRLRKGALVSARLGASWLSERRVVAHHVFLHTYRGFDEILSFLCSVYDRMKNCLCSFFYIALHLPMHVG